MGVDNLRIAADDTNRSGRGSRERLGKGRRGRRGDMVCYGSKVGRRGLLRRVVNRGDENSVERV